MNMFGGLENGDTHFYMRHVPRPPFENEYTHLFPDMIITSKWSEDLNTELITFKKCDVAELNRYYNSN